MKINKKVISNLDKCYSIAPLYYKGKQHILVAAEKTDKCIMFDINGETEETVWDEPGGVMTMVQVPGTDGQFLATHKFYSPNDSKEAKIIVATSKKEGGWEIRTLAELPHVHRFDILQRNGVKYLIACTLKSGHEFKEDWSMPGKVYAAVLPDDLSVYNQDNQLQLTVVKDGMLKNHGYYKVVEDGVETSVISSEQGVFQFFPPETATGEWKIEQLLDTPSSDAVLVDLDGDGEKELVVLAPFHGASISIYHKKNGSYEKVYDYPEPAEFTHAIWGGILGGRPAAVVGHRQGCRNLIAFTYNKEKGSYETENIDENCGPANIYHYVNEGKDIFIATNREINEVAMYIIE